MSRRAAKRGDGRRTPVLGRIAYELRSFWPRILTLFLVNLIATPLMPLAPIPLKIAADTVIGHRPLPSFVRVVTPAWFLRSPSRLLLLTAALQVIVVILADGQELLSYVLRTQTGERLTLAFRARLFRHLQRLSILMHDARGTTDSVYRVQYDAPCLQDLTTNGIIPLATSPDSVGVNRSAVGLEAEFRGYRPSEFVPAKSAADHGADD